MAISKRVSMMNLVFHVSLSYFFETSNKIRKKKAMADLKV